VKVKYSYLEEQFANPEDILNDIRELVRKGDYTLGSAVSEFEERFAKLCNTKYAVGVNSGTDALFLSMKSLNIGLGNEVITAPNTFIATVGAIVATGARPVFVDVNAEYNIDENLIEAAITSKTKAIMPVHYTGNPANMLVITDIAKRYNLYVIEDACQAIGATIDEKPVGSFGITAGFSLHPLKNLNVWGDGGIIVTNSQELADKFKLLRNHGLRNRDEVEFFGYNSRLDTLQAIVGNRLMNDVEAINNTRIKNAKTFDDALSDLSDYITIPPRKPNVKNVYHLYMIQAKDRDKLFAYLIKNGIEAKIHYPIPLHLQKASEHLGYKEGDFPVCEAQCKSIMTLPVHQHLTNQKILYIIDKIREFYTGCVVEDRLRGYDEIKIKLTTGS